MARSSFVIARQKAVYLVVVLDIPNADIGSVSHDDHVSPKKQMEYI